jgi:uncharacterized protein YlxP (DUF503 family)
MAEGNVYIGVYLVRLETPWVRSLKEKRALVKPIAERLKVRFPVSVARLAGLDSHGWELLGVTAISHDAVWLEGMLNKVAVFVAEEGGCRIGPSSLEVEVWSDADGERW